MELRTRNVGTAFATLVRGIHDGSIPTEASPSRYGNVLQLTEPAIVTLTNPAERVLLNSYRDINPFAVLMESLWMLAGRNDVATLAYYTPRFKEFSDNGETIPDAYGYRWRHSPAPSVAIPRPLRDQDELRLDQLKVVINHLKVKPESRRAVIQMWNVEDDLLKIDNSRAVCCNLSVLPSIRSGQLDLTILNRSNDLIWGLCGTNIPCFSMLGEYLAANLGVGVGRQIHFSNNLHVYQANWKPDEWLKPYQPRSLCADHSGTPLTRGYIGHGDCDECGVSTSLLRIYPRVDPYENWKSFPLVKDPYQFDRELPRIVDAWKGPDGPASRDAKCYDGAGSIPSGSVTDHPDRMGWLEPFFDQVAQPMFRAFGDYKANDLRWALKHIEHVQADDWRTAGREWLERRLKKREEKRNG